MVESLPDGRVRETYGLDEGVEEQIEALRLRTGCKDRAELIRKALDRYDFIVRRQEEGFTVQLTNGTETLVLSKQIP